MDSSDHLYRYTFDNLPVRGELVQLNKSYQQLIAGHNYPPVIQTLLGELMAVTSLLSATLKFDGHINLQMQSRSADSEQSSPIVNFATVNGSQNQQLRGLARLVREPGDASSLHQLFGNGAYLIITLTPDGGERYQGLVEVKAEDTSLAQVIERYFEQSEQLRTRVWLHSDKEKIGAMLLQALPDKTDLKDDFAHLATLTDTIQADELLNLPPTEILHRLYHEEDVRLYDPLAVTFFCGCSKTKSMNALYSVPVEELRDIMQRDGDIRLVCDYCRTEYIYTEETLAEIQGYQQSQLQ